MKQRYFTDKKAPWNKRGLFEQTCSDCGVVNFIRTQEDQYPEYYTEVFTECSCGKELKWKLPVN